LSLFFSEKGTGENGNRYKDVMEMEAELEINGKGNRNFLMGRGELLARNGDRNAQG